MINQHIVFLSWNDLQNAKSNIWNMIAYTSIRRGVQFIDSLHYLTWLEN